MASTTNPALPTLRKGDARYYVLVDGQQAGWVSKAHDGTWTFYAPVRDWHTGEIMSQGNPTRTEALYDGLSTLRIRHLGRTLGLDARHAEVPTWHDGIPAAEEALLRKMYPLSHGA